MTAEELLFIAASAVRPDDYCQCSGGDGTCCPSCREHALAVLRAVVPAIVEACEASLLPDELPGDAYRRLRALATTLLPKEHLP